MSRRIVLDASAALHLVLRTERARQLADVLLDATLVLAPGLYATEVANGLWKYVRAGALDRMSAIEHREEAIGLVDSFATDADLGAESLAEAIRLQHPVYDLVYAILARRNGCPVLTMDQRLRSILQKLEVPAVDTGV